MLWELSKQNTVGTILRRGNTQSAVEHLESGLKLMEEHQDWQKARWTGRHLSELYKKMGNHGAIG